MKIFKLYLFLLLTSLSFNAYSTEIILLNKPFSEKDPRNDYAHELLRTVLAKTIDNYGKYELSYTTLMNEERAKTIMTRTNYGDVIQAATCKSWEKELIPVRIPILKGLMGKRVFLINKAMQKKFSNINSLDELKALSLGSGHIWAITKIFEHHGFNVITGTQYDSMFKMLHRQRFDYFPRGMNEILIEYQFQRNENEDLHIEESILLNIDLPVYFFVNPTKPKLAKRIDEGLKLAIKDGSFEQIFSKHFSHIFRELNIKNRKVFNLSNPTLDESSTSKTNN